jgi:hypothetical protein
MIMRSSSFIYASAFLVSSLYLVLPAHALSMKECSAAYRKQAEGNGMSWDEFRKKQCAEDKDKEKDKGADADAGKPAASAKDGSETAAKPAKTKPEPASAGDPSKAVYPKAVNADKYKGLSDGQQRQKTCLDQYNANKASNANGGMKWIQSGGGYYSECNKRLKS